MADLFPILLSRLFNLFCMFQLTVIPEFLFHVSMNPKSTGQARLSPGFRNGRNSSSNISFSKKRCQEKRRSTTNWVHNSVKLKETYGAITSKKRLKCAMLNVDGYSEDVLADVRSVLSRKMPDVCILLETKRRLEEGGLCIDVEGYDLSEINRSDMAGDKGGGGIAIYTRRVDGLLFRDYDPDLTNPDQAFVRKERSWKTVESARGKTAICAVYAGFQAPDDRHGAWNDALLTVLRSEVSDLRRMNYRVVLLGDFNGHVGCVPGIGVVGNNPNINKNGTRFLDFLAGCQCVFF